MFLSLESDQTSNLCDKIYSGNCPGGSQRIVYDKASKECKSFKFNGCFGNKNAYETMSDCEARHSKCGI